MKKHIVPAVLFIAVFCFSILFQRHTFLHQEYVGLFISTPDYFSSVAASDHPLVNLIGGFLVQFYRVVWVGPLVTALIVLLTFLLWRSMFRFFGRWRDAAAIVPACGLWVSLALGVNPGWGVIILTVSGILAAFVALFARTCKGSQSGFASRVISFAIIAVAALLLAISPKIRVAESWGRVEQGARTGDWDKVIRAATPKMAEKEPQMMPYAFFALGQKGILADRLFDYPVTGPQDFDANGVTTWHGYFYKTVESENEGCINEALHHTFQSACTLDRGLSFGVLRQLIRYSIAAGNDALARKYCDVLQRSPFNAKTAHDIKRLLDSQALVPTLPIEASDSAAVVMPGYFHNMRILFNEGCFTDASADLVRCHLLLERDLRNFAQTFSSEEDLSNLPITYQQALCIINDSDLHTRLSLQVKDAFKFYMDKLNTIREKGSGAIMEGSFWDYYFIGGAGDEQY